MYEKRILGLEKALEERDKTHRHIIETYEGWVYKFKADLDHEKGEKL